MKKAYSPWHYKFFVPAVFIAAVATLAGGAHLNSTNRDSANGIVVEEFIIQGASVDLARAAVEGMSGQIIAELAVIRAVAAELTQAQVDALQGRGMSVTPNYKIGVNAKNKTQLQDVSASYNQWIGVDALHGAGIDGSGVSVAFIDTGLWKNAAKAVRLTEWVDVSGASFEHVSGHKAKNAAFDGNGHGTHITSLVGSRNLTKDGVYEGVAPGAGIVAVRAFDDNGSGSYLDVLEGMNWVVENKERLNIGVLNLSFGAQVKSHYWDDPINQAAMALWQAGIVVVTSAGNQGSDAMSVGVPGNNPYVITVGAASDNQTAGDLSDDFLTSFSSSGPTHEGFVKPELIAPGDAIVAMMDPKSSLGAAYADGGRYLGMSGTSQSAAIISGVAALMLQADSSLTPNDVKCRLMLSADAASGESAYSVFQQGAGLVNAVEAVESVERGCANLNMDIAADLAGEQHFAGPADQDENGNFVVVSDGEQLQGEGYSWGGNYSFSLGYIWGTQSLFSEGYPWRKTNFIGPLLWSNGYPWRDNQLIWVRSNPEPDFSTAQSQGYPWRKVALMHLDAYSESPR